MAKLILMPEIAANATSAVIKQWSKQEGDSIRAGECLAEIETDKALIEFDADEAGVLGKILAVAGKDIEVGTPIAVLFAEGETNVDIAAVLAAAGVEKPVAQTVPANAAPGASATVATAPASAAASDVPASGRLFASPLARRLAKNRGIDLQGIKGSGPRGRIVKCDIDAIDNTVAVPAKAAPAVAASAPAIGAAYVEVAHSGMRKTIARRLSESKASIPHFYLSAPCRMDKLMALRAEINASSPRKISINDFIIKAVAATLKAFPQMNVSWTEQALRQYAAADISVAVSTDGGLITPVVRAADSKSLSAISAEVTDLAARARAGQLTPDEYQGGSFTISNLGMFGVQEFSAIINPPQAAILAVGATSQQAVVTDGELAVASVMTVTLSVDHRAIDGAVAAQWLALFQRYLEHPLSTLI